VQALTRSRARQGTNQQITCQVAGRRAVFGGSTRV
jgi:hypothetical protein